MSSKKDYAVRLRYITDRNEELALLFVDVPRAANTRAAADKALDQHLHLSGRIRDIVVYTPVATYDVEQIVTLRPPS